jgi:hypothetical protein
MKNIILLMVMLLIASCATIPKATQPVQDFKIVQRVIETDASGKVLVQKDTYEPAVPFNFWSELIPMVIGIGKKVGGL